MCLGSLEVGNVDWMGFGFVRCGLGLVRDDV